MNISINNRITIDVTLVAKKKKGDTTMYDLYIYFTINEGGIYQQRCTLSTGIDILVSEYNNGKVVGRSVKAKQKETRLNEYLTAAAMLVEDLRAKKIKTCSELKFEIDQNARQRITGKVARGFKQDAISRLESLTYKRILDKYLSNKQLQKDRKRNYFRTEKLLNEYFKNDVPTIDQITGEDMEDFKKWFSKTYPQTDNSINTYLAMVSAIFKFAVKSKLIQVSPIPTGFTGGFVKGKRDVLSTNEILAIMAIEDSNLSHGLQVAKYCLLLQVLTGMGYSDVKSLRHDNLKFNQDFKRKYIQKNRNKTSVEFTVIESSQCTLVLDKLRSLSIGEDLVFNLPTIENISRLYKKLAKMAGITTNVSTYTLRHTFAVDYMENDGRIEDLSKCLGHKDLKTTQIYGEISQKRAISFIEVLRKISSNPVQEKVSFFNTKIIG